MKDLIGKVAVITGAGSGIGRGTALALVDAGVDVVVADIDWAAAQRVAEEIERRGQRALAVQTDVSDSGSVRALADAAYDAFGAVHILHNNAGVGAYLRIDETTEEDWRWILSVNLGGVINGVHHFLPRMKAQPGEKHIVNTASMAGLWTSPHLGAYSTAKYGVVAISEVLRSELAAERIGVSVLVPGDTRTNIARNSSLHRPAGQGPDDSFDDSPPEASAAATHHLRTKDPEEVGRLVRRGIENDLPYIITHPEFRVELVARFEALLSAFDRAAELERDLSIAMATTYEEKT